MEQQSGASGRITLIFYECILALKDNYKILFTLYDEDS